MKSLLCESPRRENLEILVENLGRSAKGSKRDRDLTCLPSDLRDSLEK